MTSTTSEVVLLNGDGTPSGTARKDLVHTTDTPLHLAFSCHVLNTQGQVLVSRRALGKLTWAGVWTNAFCGHPLPGESMSDAVARHAEHELGLSVRDVTLELPDFRYRATDASGIVENELCPVHLAVTDAEPSPRPDEVVETRWCDPADVGVALRAAPWAFSPWFVLQARELAIYQAPTTDHA